MFEDLKKYPDVLHDNLLAILLCVTTLGTLSFAPEKNVSVYNQLVCYIFNPTLEF